MTTTDELVEDQPGKPYKALGAAAGAAAAQLLAAGLELPSWATVTLTIVAGFGGAYAPRNPKRERARRKRR